MTTKENAAREALRKTSLETHHVETAIAALRRGGLLDERANTDALYASAAPIKTLSAAAADSRNRVLVKSVIAEAKSLGVTIDPDKPIDPYALSADLKKAAVASPAQVWRLKTNLASLGAL
jgi:hypothetical protein